LRRNLGYGGYPYGEKRTLHRSKESRKDFEKLEELAESKNLNLYTSINLLDLLMTEPSPLITGVLKESCVEVKKKKDEPVISDRLFVDRFKGDEAVEENRAQKINSLPFLVRKLLNLRSELLSNIFGQSHAVQDCIEGFYNAFLLSGDRDRNSPLAVFIFAGPPGVGKTYMASLCTTYFSRPFKSFDMTLYSDHQQHTQLTGFPRSYAGAKPGLLTGFVKKNPDAFLLFDEIEKAHLNTIHLFYGILDRGKLEDHYTGEEVSFTDTVIVFTTNAGKSLYENQNRTGISVANSSYHRKTVLSALSQEKNPITGNSVFPSALCSRFSRGYPVMFNYLGVNELKRVSEEAIIRTEELLSKEYNKKFSHDELLPMSLVLREGYPLDARGLKAETEKFIKTELFKFCSLYEKHNLEEALAEIETIRFEPDKNHFLMKQEISSLYEPSEKLKILFVADRELSDIYSTDEIEWFNVFTEEEAVDILSSQDINMVLLDLWTKSDKKSPEETGQINTIAQGQDFTPLSARSLEHGRNILRKIHSRFPHIPVYLLSIINKKEKKYRDGETRIITPGYDPGKIMRKSVDEELFFSCLRSGGARGIIETDFIDSTSPDLIKNQFITNLRSVNIRLYREKKAAELMREKKVLTFDTVPSLDKKKKKLSIKLRDFRLVRVMEASDASELINDVERPDIKFEDIIGAASAKESLQFLVKWLKNPKKYSSMGVRPPKGILLTGHPGTGKTMMARALAGESDCAFIEASATGFVTVWQGSGPQNIRNLFDRARRYAPSIVFIDEIDSIGGKRSGSPGGSARSEEATLNALLTEMDGFKNFSDRPVILLGATNLIENLDTALRRRFDREITMEKPDRSARFIYIEKSLLNRKNNSISRELIENMAKQSAGMTLADLERIIQEAAVMSAEKGSFITDELLHESFEKIRMGDIKTMPSLSILKRIARHESGHALIAWLGGNAPVQITIIGRGYAGGYMEREADEDMVIYTKPELEQRICEAMGGRASEILYYGEEEGLSTGASEDLKKATSIARMMVLEFGMSKDFGFLSVDKDFSPTLSIEIKVAIDKIIREQLERALKILEENRKYLNKLSKTLLENNRLTKEEMKKILP
jgi:ATP-dependent metalloprotease FtsH